MKLFIFVGLKIRISKVQDVGNFELSPMHISTAMKLPAEHCLIFYFIEKPFNTFANRSDTDRAALVRAA